MKKTKIYGLMLLGLCMAFTACTNLSDSAFVPQNTTEESIIYSETFASDLGLFTVKSVSGTENWAFNTSGYALMTGYISTTKVNNADESWLISPEIDLTNIAAAHFTFDYVARYFANPATDATVLVSDNYTTTDSLPTSPSVTWSNVVMEPIIDPNAWPSPMPTSNQISLTSYAGKKVRIAFRYISTTAKAGTWELKNFVVSKGEAVNLPGNTGKEASPYTVADAMKNTGASKYVKGYVVGYMWPTPTAFIFSGDTCTQLANVLIADTVSNVYVSNCLLVQLPVGVVRDGLNLKDNATLLGQEVTVYGLIGSSSYGLNQMSNTSYFILPDGTTGGVKPIEPIISETFAKTFGEFTTQNVSGAQTWGISFSAATMTGYASPTNYENEDWLISPEMDLTDISDAKLTFSHVIRYCTNPVTDGTLWVSENYVEGLPSTAMWTQLPTSTFRDPGSWTFSTIGPISLSPYSGKKIRFAFKYLSTASKAGTWEIQNVLVLKQ